MQTIIIKLFPEKLKNPDLDLRYRIPDRIEEISEGRITAMIILTTEQWEAEDCTKVFPKCG